MRRSQIPDCFAQELFLSALKSLAHALQAKDPYTAGHALRVSLVAKAVAQELGLSPPEVRQIGFAAELHDIGKIGISERLLHKRGPLTDYEYDEVMRHTMIGEQIIAPLMGVDLTVKEVVRWHHERMNGTGTPDGLSGDDIPLAARVVAVADAFDAMTSARPYRTSLSLDAARRELLENAGTQFDPECVEALVRLLDLHSPLPTPHGEWRVGSGEWDIGS
ncbi:MAG: HD-GYP domain-containing protein [Gemmatimonadetes bacterium]|nr:HD-GYP domain-containing protein [Gemmatimonadota bacterium]